MLNPGNKVWVEVSRDRERMGTIKGADLEAGNVLVELENSEVVSAKITSLRPAGAKTISMPKGGTKHDDGKVRVELIPHEAIFEIGAAFTFGAKKYADHNWAKGFNWLRLVGASMRHIVAWAGGEDKDPESGLSHLAHAGACICMLIAHEKGGLGEDDRRKS